MNLVEWRAGVDRDGAARAPGSQRRRGGIKCRSSSSVRFPDSPSSLIQFLLATSWPPYGVLGSGLLEISRRRWTRTSTRGCGAPSSRTPSSGLAPAGAPSTSSSAAAPCPCRKILIQSSRACSRGPNGRSQTRRGRRFPGPNRQLARQTASRKMLCFQMFS